MTRLFVYGTLAPGEENAHIMDGMTGTWIKASVRGRRVSTGCGSLGIHPGFFPDEKGELVQGLIFESQDLPQHWDRLDKFEGKDYKRVAVTAALENGEQVQAHIYSVLPPKPMV